MRPEVSAGGMVKVRAPDTPRAPHIVIDDQGYEVGVVIEYAQYVTLLGLLASAVGRDRLPPYWQGALDGCLSLQ